MPHQSRNRYLAALKLLLDNPIAWPLFMIDHLRRRKTKHRLAFDDINLTIRAGTPDLTVVRACLLGEFEEAIKHTDSDAEFLVDAGGYIGLVSVLLARRFPNARIVCIEPSSENYTMAMENCAPYGNVTVMNAALGAASGVATLRDRGTGQWGFTITNFSESPTHDVEDVTVVSLPGIMQNFGANKIDFLKLDIEGAEYELFEAADTWIGHCGVLIVELHERIRPGVEALYAQATSGRRTLGRNAEKHLTVLA